MNLKIEMSLDNDAFKTNTREMVQIAITDVLWKVGDWRETPDGVSRPIPIMDVNGNTVGTLLIG